MIKKVLSKIKDSLWSKKKTGESPLESKNVKFMMKLEDPEATMEIIKGGA